jgi:serine/threonine protein kinase
MTEVWTKWESQVINGVFPLRRLLSGSKHSAVFLTEYKAQNYPTAAIKLVPDDPALAEVKLSNLKVAAGLSHPHLIRLFEAGRCRLDGEPFLFVVMEYAEQCLSQILPQRALTPEEVREMLVPTLDALAFLHHRGLVQCQLKPANFLVVNDQLKLASDTIRAAGDSTAGIAGDVWDLGVTLVEALTQHPPTWSDDGSEALSLPPTFPADFADTVLRCLSRNPADRPTVADLQAKFTQSPQAAAVSIPIPQTEERQASGTAAAPPTRPKQRWFAPAVAAVLLVSVALWAGLFAFQRHPNSKRPAAITGQSSAQQPDPPALEPRADSAAFEAARSPPSVIHEEIPDVSRHARESIHGHIKVTVRVTVDGSGNVVGEAVEKSGSSKYFARLSAEAAGKWKFAAAADPDPRVWLVRFDFSRGGATAHAATPR